MNKFEEIFNDDNQISPAGSGLGEVLYSVVQSIMGNGHIAPPLREHKDTSENIIFLQLC